MNYNKKTQITVVGVSAHPEKYGHKIFRDLLAAKYDVVGVNPKGGTLFGEHIAASLSEVPRRTQLLLVVVPPEIGISVIQQAHTLGITDIWLQPGAESAEIVRYAKENSMSITANHCFMVAQGIW